MPLFSRLSQQAVALWAKTDQADPHGGWLPLYQHMADSAETVRLLWRYWLAESTRHEVIAHAGSSEAAEALAVWLAAVHDLGKAAPGFQHKAFKVPQLVNQVRDAGLPILNLVPPHPPRHALMSQVLLKRWLVEERGWKSPVALTYAIIPGGHHGAPPNSRDERLLRTTPPLSSTIGPESGPWRAVQDELCAWNEDRSG
ncbi:MAG: CRISPR-associated endonuclease Cas3'', partial [Propionibacteriaceae bacterium]|nr:CRISPR-associated endonuclease Cas3'' [Propionibacteriaceae bacterium]